MSPSILPEMAAFFRAELEKGEHKAMLVLFASGRAMQQFLTHVTDPRLMLLVQRSAALSAGGVTP